VTTYPFLHGKPPPARLNDIADLASWLRTFWDSYVQARHGKLDCVTEITLTANAATTTFNYIRLSPQSVVTFDPKTANAATELYGATMYVLTANRGNKVWTITHANNAQADRTFAVSVIG
jgi:hypothetical protein